MNFASVKLLFKPSTRGVIRLLNNATASFTLSTHPDAFLPNVYIWNGVQPISPSPKTATFLAPAS